MISNTQTLERGQRSHGKRRILVANAITVSAEPLSIAYCRGQTLLCCTGVSVRCKVDDGDVCNEDDLWHHEQRIATIVDFAALCNTPESETLFPL
jgi:hypothetical protein